MLNPNSLFEKSTALMPRPELLKEKKYEQISLMKAHAGIFHYEHIKSRNKFKS
jgi:hypothetical protein